jgi:cell division protein FtsL
MKSNLLRKLRSQEAGNVQLILMAVVAAIVLAISIVIVYAVLGGINYVSVDTALGGSYNATSGVWTGPHPATNASAALQSNLATFYSVSPIYIVVLAAVGIISAIMMIVITRKK